jgi:molecular chaperone DnaJ
MQVLRSNQLGDMYIQVSIETPQNLTSRQRKILREFEEVSSEENSPESTGFFARMKTIINGLAD